MKKFPGDDLHIKEKRGVVLLSGGIDSTVVTELAIRGGWELIALTVDYGQARAELTAARLIASHYKLGRFTMDLRVSWMKLAPSRLMGGKREILTLEEIRQRERSPYIVPARNTMLLSCSLALVESRDLQAIFFGGSIEDALGFPDCRPEFLKAFEVVASASAQRKIHVISPMLQSRKQDIVKIGSDLGSPLNLTSTCYRAQPLNTPDGVYSIHCGRCPSCLLRKEAFENAKVKDPTYYASET